ncbi:general secretion pathway protein GspN [Stenotrophomonas sp. HITSZ_GD]|uniref:general secretion pathway protein GspN n=1 Tax=Stenotrophomonas sp. HITSZ_GD TaxID=3037248 RepID=UPI00240DC927|nr:general secretion pathway protein GspN [Stenotrophomonas sp. HITSZ_GD]MDG2525688.1 general secretion pathway protein GspN [Stenotrophomonas sp. HITSZ_GD]
MRPDAIGLRLGWRAVFAGWAVLVAVLAGLGMGSRLPAEDAALPARPLPAIPTAPPRRLGELSAYAAIAQRPVFAEDRRPHPFFLGGSDAPQATGLRLTGVLLTPRFQMATITTDQGRSLRLRLQGDAVDGWRLLTLAPRSATVEGPGGVRTLDMQVFDGRGGEAPTALRGAAPANTPAMPAPPPNVTPVAAPVVVAPAPAAAPTSQGGVPAAAAAAPPAPPAPSEDQLKAIRERIEARRRALQQQQQNPQRNGDAAVPQNP